MHDGTCPLCGHAREAEQNEKFFARLLSNVRTVDFHMIGVPEDDEGSGFAYTVGLEHTLGHPDVIVTGLDVDVSFALLHEVVGLIRSGARLADGSRREDVLANDVPVQFRSMSGAWYPEYVQQAVNFYGADTFTMLVLYWPDQKGNFPWDAAAPRWLCDRQSALWAPERAS